MSSSDVPPDDAASPPVAPAVAVPLSDMSLDAAVKWLESEALTTEQKDAINRGTDNVSAKLEIFKAMLGVQRSARLASSMAWLEEVTDNLFNAASRDKMRTDSFFALSVGQFIRALQEDDTKFLATLSKVADPKVLDEARKKAQVSDRHADIDSADAAVVSKLLKMAPHNRERLRKLIQSLENTEEGS